MCLVGYLVTAAINFFISPVLQHCNHSKEAPNPTILVSQTMVDRNHSSSCNVSARALF